MLWSEMTMSHSPAASADRRAGPVSTRVTSGSKPWRWSSIFEQPRVVLGVFDHQDVDGSGHGGLLIPALSKTRGGAAATAFYAPGGSSEARVPAFDADGTGTEYKSEQDRYHGRKRRDSARSVTSWARGRDGPQDRGCDHDLGLSASSRRV